MISQPAYRLCRYLLALTTAFFVTTIARCADETAATSAKQLHFFETNVRPLLHSRCVKCHGESQQKGGLRLDSLEALLKGGESGPAAVPGKPAESLMLEAVRYESFEMPPDKPLSASEISDLESWITAGTAWTRKNGTSVRLQGTAFTTEERSFWSFQPLRHTDPPASPNWGLNSIDAFIAARLTAAGIDPTPRASEDVLLRRLYFGVLGVPPAPVEISDLKSEIRQQQWPELVDRLLADPRYGEHWARHWLDIVRYAESDGFRADFYRPDAWRYRDYVVNAFNDDKPYDQFVTEQLAGDEIAPVKAEALIATGYLRTFLYEYNQRDARTQWQDILNQVTDVTGEVFLGIGVGCARCHDHKFDPILQEDYYRLQACFGTMIPRDDVPAADLIERQRYSTEHDAWLAQATELRKELDDLRAPYMTKAAKGAIERFPEDIQVIMAKSPADRMPLEAQLADLVDRQILYDQEREKIKDEEQKRIDELEKRIAEISTKEPAKLPTAITVADVGGAPQIIHLGADPNRRSVSAGGFSIIDSAAFQLQPSESSTGQRTALARWITSPENPLAARVIVNRVWQQHFGRGLVDTASDFGSLGGRPTHPELLDWLATELIANSWSIKWLHRQILTSATWQMSAFHPNAAEAESADPGNRLRWRSDIRRLSAEQIRDAMLTVSGELHSEQGGPSVEPDSLRRSLYVKMLRNTPEPLMASLDGVDGLNSIPKRSTTTTPTQALNLMNGDWVRQRSRAMAKRLLDELDGTNAPAELVDGAFRAALGRHADDAEISVGMTLLQDAGARSAASRKTEFFMSVSETTGAAIELGADALPPLATAGNAPAIAAPFTFAGIIRLNSLYPDAAVRTIISQWNSDNKTNGWAIGVTSTKSAFQPRNLILQVVSDTGYKVVASDLRPELGEAYLVAVAVELLAPSGNENNQDRAKATFYLRPLDGDAESLQRVEVVFPSAANLTGTFPVVLGGRAKQSGHRWDGQLDQMALFADALNAETITKLFEERLDAAAVKASAPLAFWSFNDTDNPFADNSANEHNLKLEDVQKVDPLENALAELCHVLLNSNEFVYID